jgi:ABC-type lipoprotein export system ATPase subunit/ABC-type antimicrobial peptide transport system permease subunit
MITLNNLNKIYSNGVHALKDVNLSFKDKGLFFIIGKSGSGKSTLLNILGGLDQQTSGTYLYGNQDLHDIDLNAFRNSAVGFVFQEFNLIETLTVKENLEIALKLQGIKTDDKIVNDALMSVELEGYQDRLPNTLSGGQKQRVAIARALIKKPSVLLADEPTGSLDSETSTQVFELLKELSKDILVIVVSHDKESAEHYQDGLIELKDGKVISNNLSDSQTSPIGKPLIKATMPISAALKLGFNHMRFKKTRIAFVTMIFTLSLLVFSVSSTFLFYDKDERLISSYYDNNRSYVYLDVNERSLSTVSDETFDSHTDGYNQSFVPLYRHLSVSFYDHLATSSNYIFMDTINGSIEMNASLLARLNLSLIAGSLPQSDDEINITDLMFDTFKKTGYRYDQSTFTITTPNDIIGKKLKLNNQDYTITGIINTGFNFEKYTWFYNQSDIDDELVSILFNELKTVESYSIHTVVFLNQGYHERFLSHTSGSFNFNTYPREYVDLSRTYLPTYSVISSLKDIQFSKTYNLDNVDLSNGYFYYLPLSKYSQQGISYDSEETYNVMVNVFASEHYDEIKSSFDLDHPDISYSDYIKTTEVNEYHPGKDRAYFRDEAFTYMVNYRYGTGNPPITMSINNDDIEATFVGFYDDTDMAPIMYMSEALFDKVHEDFDLGYVSNYIGILSGNLKQDIELTNSKDFTIRGDLPYQLDQIYATYETVSFLFVVISVIMGIVSFLFLMNYIQMSISTRKKEIGLLRALGCKISDVYKIYLTESLTITSVSVIITWILSIVSVMILNDYFNSRFKYLISFTSYSFREAIFVLLISVVTVLVATTYPVIRYARKNPMDSIRDIL